MTLPIEVVGESLMLRADRTMFWPRTRTLVLSDPHFGKAEAFRAAGLPVPGGSAEPLVRLTLALQETHADRLVILGDFWHAAAGRTTGVLDELRRWRSTHRGLHLVLIRGNHDRAGPPPPTWNEWTDTLVEPPFVFSHYPEASELGYVLSGHLHPAIVLGRERLRLPCFWFGPAVAVLPAFGSFTGSATVTPQRSDRIFAIADSEVIEIRFRG